MEKTPNIAPALLEKIQKDFDASFRKNAELRALYQKIKAANPPKTSDGNRFAKALGQMTAEVFKRDLSPEDLPNGRLTYEIALALLRPLMVQNHSIIGEVMKEIIKALNTRAGLELRPIDAKLDESRITNLAAVASADDYENVQTTVCRALDTFTRNAADDYIKENAAFQYGAGLVPRISRETDGDCCAWCSDIAGTYDYDKAPKDIFGRHADCSCTLDFIPARGSGRAARRVWDASMVKEKHDKRAEADESQRKTPEERAKAAEALEQLTRQRKTRK